MFNWLRRMVGGGKGSKSSRPRSHYDAAKSTDENRKHWANADALSANAVASPEARRVLRNRSRYEYDNNGYYSGPVDSIADDLIGTGPRLQLNAGGEEYREQARAVEIAFGRWCLQIGLADKLRLVHVSRVRDGESFVRFFTNPIHPADGVQLDLQVIEADQCQDARWHMTDNGGDGVETDANGNVVAYRFLRNHPGDTSWTAGVDEADRYPAEDVFHWFRKRRAGQLRGVPEFAAALPLFAILRRYTLATLNAAELAACLTAVLKSALPPGDESDSPGVEAMDTIEIVRNMLMTLPEGWDLQQFDPKQPVTGYGEFKAEVLCEIGRTGAVPYNVMSGNSSKYNYSSGRLDYLIYHRSLRTLRHQLRAQFLDRLFRRWHDEAVLVRGLLPAGLPPLDRWTWEWNWDGFDSIDPLKEAKADGERLTNLTTTLSEVYAAYGQDWQEQLQQIAREQSLMKELGVERPGKAPAMAATTGGPEEDGGEGERDD